MTKIYKYDKSRNRGVFWQIFIRYFFSVIITYICLFLVFYIYRNGVENIFNNNILNNILKASIVILIIIFFRCIVTFNLNHTFEIFKLKLIIRRTRKTTILKTNEYDILKYAFKFEKARVFGCEVNCIKIVGIGNKFIRTIYTTLDDNTCNEIIDNINEIKEANLTLKNYY